VSSSEGVVETLLGDGGERAVARAQNGLFWKSEDAVAKPIQSGLPSKCRTAHGSREEGIAGEGEGTLEAGDNIGCSACRVAVGRECAHLESADLKFHAVGK
jgi:hypothetical protein